MIAQHDDFVRALGAANLGHHVPDRLDGVVHAHPQPDLRRAGAEVVGEGQPALPLTRRHRAAEVLQDDAGVGIRERQHRQVGHVGGVGGSDARCARDRRAVGGGGVAGVVEDVEHRAALHARGRPPGAVGIGVAAVVAVVFRVGVDDQRRRFVFFRYFGLHAAEAAAVARNHYFAFG